MGYFLGQHNPSNYFALTIIELPHTPKIKFDIYVFQLYPPEHLLGFQSNTQNAYSNADITLHIIVMYIIFL